MITVENKDNVLIKIYKNLDKLDFSEYEEFDDSDHMKVISSFYIYINLDTFKVSLTSLKENYYKFELTKKEEVDLIKNKLKDYIESVYDSTDGFMNKPKVYNNEFKKLLINPYLFDIYDLGTIINEADEYFIRQHNVKYLVQGQKLFELISDEDLITLMPFNDINLYILMIGKNRFRSIFKRAIDEKNELVTSMFQNLSLYLKLMDVGQSDLILYFLENLQKEDIIKFSEYKLLYSVPEINQYLKIIKEKRGL